jgi:predicted AlkP superfamily phosphohydrolase/phosphomutase
MPHRKLLIIGIDGASTNVLNSIIASENLGTFAEIWKDGIVASLHVNPNDRGWPTILTGQSAADLGSFYFWKDPAARRPRMEFDGTPLQRSSFIDVVSAAGGRVITVNCPLTYPTWDINGIMVSGAGGGSKPDLARGVYPAEMLSRYEDTFSSYRFDVRRASYSDMQPVLMVKDLITMTRARSRLASELLDKEPWDLSFIVFVGIDRLLHWMWDALPAVGETPSTELTREIGKYFRELDAAIARLIDVSPGADILLISDHGFQKVAKKFYINDWLVQQGFQCRKPDRVQIITSGKKLLKKLLHSIRRTGTISNAVLSGSDKTYLPELYWSRTRAYGDRAAGVFIVPDLPEKEKARCASELLARINMECHASLAGVASSALAREKLYGAGMKLALSPEVLIALEPEVQVVATPRNCGMNRVPSESRPSYTDWKRMPTMMQGIHASNALFAAYGSAVKNCCKGEENLQDFFSIVRRFFAL